MNDLLYRALFGFLIAERQGVERNEAFKIGLLGAMDNSKGLVLPVLNAKLMAEDKVEIKNLSEENADLVQMKAEVLNLVNEIDNASNATAKLTAFNLLLPNIRIIGPIVRPQSIQPIGQLPSNPTPSVGP